MLLLQCECMQYTMRTCCTESRAAASVLAFCEADHCYDFVSLIFKHQSIQAASHCKVSTERHASTAASMP
jgi:hypothetical protein